MAAVTPSAIPGEAATLHYVFDPLCGWCYAAAPLIEAARSVSCLTIALHGGGMLTGDKRRPITPQWRSHVMPHDQRIAQLSSQPFGAAYFEGLLRDTGAMMDSAPPTTAILAAQRIAGRGLDMLHRLQRAHYVEGRRIAEAEVLAALADELTLDPKAFAAAFKELEGMPTQRHFEDSRQWLHRLGGHGFPTMALERADGAIEPLDSSRWLGRAGAWRAHLVQLTASGDATPGQPGPDVSSV
jgi:putative protein-disulfide isomerase